MKKENQDILRAFSTVGSLGITLVVSTFAGLGIGLFLDKVTKLRPLFTIVMLLAGIFAGLIYIVYKSGSYGKK